MGSEVEEEKTKNYVCKCCGKSFSNERNQYSHRDNHPNDPMKCLLCKDYVVYSDPKSHLKHVHQIEKPIICRCCDWTFRCVKDFHHHRAFLRQRCCDVTHPVVLNKTLPGFFCQKKDQLVQESIDVLTIWQNKELSKPVGRHCKSQPTMPRSSSYKTPNPNVSIQMTSTPNINCYPVPQTSSPIIPNIDSAPYAYAHNSNNIYRTTDNYNYWNYTETTQPPTTLQTNFSLDTPFTESSTTGISNGNNNITWNNDTDEAKARERFWKWLDGIPD